MTAGTQFTIGSDVACRDGAFGRLTRVVVDPVRRALTHLVVEPRHGGAAGRLVPVELVASVAETIELRCDLADLESLDEAEVTEFLPGASGGPWGYGQGQMLSWPYYGLGIGGLGMGGMAAGPQAVTYDRVPVGEVQVRRGEPVHATDGPIGRVKGLVIDPADHHVTHVLLDEGHLWGHKRIAVPISAVTGVEDGIQLALSKDDVRDLPPVELDPEA